MRRLNIYAREDQRVIVRRLYRGRPYTPKHPFAGRKAEDVIQEFAAEFHLDKTKQYAMDLESGEFIEK